MFDESRDDDDELLTKGSAVRVGFRSIKTPKIRKFGRSGELLKYGKTKFRSDVLKNGKIPRFDLVGFRRTENQETKIRSGGNPKIRSGGLPKNENPKIKIRKCGGLLTNENPKIKIRAVRWASEERKPKDKDSFRWASEERKPKDKEFRWASEERKPKDKDSFGVSEFPKNESPKDSFVNRKPKFVSFGKSGTKIRLVSQADSKEQKKTKDSFSGFPKNQDSRTLGEWQRTAAKKSAKVRPALDHKSA
ncbi:unnamed protein product [Rhizophagus irregularis]|nr:unnamed protein product [Rhizophagus irregularis]